MCRFPRYGSWLAQFTGTKCLVSFLCFYTANYFIMRRVCKTLFLSWHCIVAFKKGAQSYAFMVRNILPSPHPSSPFTQHSLDQCLGPPEEESCRRTSPGEAQDGQDRSRGPTRRCILLSPGRGWLRAPNQQEAHLKCQSKQNHIHHLRSEKTLYCYAETYTAGNAIHNYQIITHKLIY